MSLPAHVWGSGMHKEPTFRVGDRVLATEEDYRGKLTTEEGIVRDVSFVQGVYSYSILPAEGKVRHAWWSADELVLVQAANTWREGDRAYEQR